MKKETHGTKSLSKFDSIGQLKSTFSIEHLFDTPVTKAWNALTRNDEIKQWFFDLPEFRPEIGFEFSWVHKESKNQSFIEYTHFCKIIEVIPERKLVYTWQYVNYEGYSEVQFELFKEVSKTLVKVTHTGINSFPQQEGMKIEDFVDGWTIAIKESLHNYLLNKN